LDCIEQHRGDHILMLSSITWATEGVGLRNTFHGSVSLSQDSRMWNKSCHVVMYTVILTIMERTRVLYGSDLIFYILLTGKLD